MEQHTTVVWFRRDLRLHDHAALAAAVKRGNVVPVYIWSPDEEGEVSPGAASRWWLHQSLSQLDQALGRLGSRLIFRSGPIVPTLEKLCSEVNADGLVWHRMYEVSAIRHDEAVRARLGKRISYIESFPGYLMVEPSTLLNQSGRPYQVFPPFWKRCVQGLALKQPISCPRALDSPKVWPKSDTLSEWGLQPPIPWTQGIAARWTPGEKAARILMSRFVKKRVLQYGTQRNRPDCDGTSELSPSLHFGEISPGQIWDALRRFAERESIAAPVWKGWQFVAELGWREFAGYLLHHFPHTPTEPLRPEFERYPWDSTKEHLSAWQRGQTGYPIVDAGMRQLWTTGWMHNRVRMIVASFLVKHLRIPWQEGADWFWDTLVDADLANNTLGWQWTTGCGADASPYFRIFNPMTQGEKFDPHGGYVRRWVPELAHLPDKYLNRPWEAPPKILTQAKVRLGVDYPNPVVDHGVARQCALDGYAEMRAGR
ncbi:MAG: deoxyribodipyrimidine photo-lyase [Bacteroidetes Order II. Incertae sedis bacterium]|nr:deoxyribodipyrimidine photo-lyase [Bacteroidetes Order II. bacterium]